MKTFLKNIFIVLKSVFIKDSLRINLFTVLKGNNKYGLFCSIGKSYFCNSLLGNYSKIDRSCSIVDSEIKEYVAINSSVKCYKTTIGRYSYICDNSLLAYTKVGAFCSIGHRLMCAGADHPINWVSTSPVFYSTRKQCGSSFSTEDHYQEIKNITIGNDVWIGNNVTILGNVKIGDGAIIAAGAVVNKDVPDYAIYGGVPAKLIRYRFSENVIKGLKKIEWWNWSPEKLNLNVSLFRQEPSELIRSGITA